MTEFTGKVTHIVPYDGKSKWVCASFRLEEDTGERYPNSIAVNLWNDKVDMLEEISVGDTVYVQLNCKCRVDAQGRLWNGLSCWSLLNQTAEEVRRQQYATNPTLADPPPRQPEPPKRIGQSPRANFNPHWEADGEPPF